MTTRISHKNTGTFIRQLRLNNPDVSDITGWQINIRFENKDGTTLYHLATTEGVDPEIVITDGPNRLYDVTIDDTSSWPNAIIFCDFLHKDTDDNFLPSEDLEIKHYRGRTQRWV